MKLSQFILGLLMGVVLMEIARADDDMGIIAMKRPFCNTFTGCGKRSDESANTDANANAAHPQLITRALRLYPNTNLRNDITEAKIRQRIAAAVAAAAAAAAAEDPAFIVDNLESFALPRGASIY